MLIVLDPQKLNTDDHIAAEVSILSPLSARPPSRGRVAGADPMRSGTGAAAARQHGVELNQAVDQLNAISADLSIIAPELDWKVVSGPAAIYQQACAGDQGRRV